MRPSLAAIFIIALYISSCGKQDQSVGIGLYSNDNNLGAHFVDTFTVNAVSKVEDSVPSSNLGIVNLGFYTDPFFGKTEAGFYTQFEIGGSGVDFGDTLTCDSIVLFLKLGSGDLSYYGPENKPLKINVQQISRSADFTKDSLFYSSSSLPLNRESLVDPSFDNLIQPNFFDTVYLSRDSSFSSLQIPGVIAIKLKREFGQQLLDLNGSSTLSSNANFLEEYKGLYVSIEDENGSDIIFIDMANFGTAVMIYYKEGSEQEDEEYKFIIDAVSAHFNKYDHDYEQSGSIKLLASMQDSTVGDQYHFTQTGGGYKSYIKFPTLIALRDSQPLIPVNKAELIVPVEPGSTKEYAPPSIMYLFWVNDEGVEEFILDQGYSEVDGNYDRDKQQYRFNIIRHVQAILNGDINTNSLVMKTGNPGSTPNRVLMNGNMVDTSYLKPMKLRIYYSSLIN